MSEAEMDSLEIRVKRESESRTRERQEDFSSRNERKERNTENEIRRKSRHDDEEGSKLLNSGHYSFQRCIMKVERELFTFSSSIIT